MKTSLLLMILLFGAGTSADTSSWSAESEPEPVCADFLSLTPNHLTLKNLGLRAARKLAQIKHAAAAQPKSSRGYFEQIVRAAEAAVTKHQPEYLEEPDLRKLDFQRHLAILEEIERFDELRPQYSLFKIKRVIETRHSIRKYADCIEDDDAHPAAH